MKIVNDTTVYRGRPLEKRSECEEKVYDILNFLNIPFERIDHLQANTIDDCHEIEKFLNATICKNLFLTNNKNDVFCLLLIPGEKKYQAGKVSRQIGSSRLSFAGNEQLKKFLNLTPGSVSIMGLLNDSDNKVTLAIDSDLLKNEYFCCHPCINTSTLKFKTSDIIEKFIPFTKREMKIINM